jgi:predicted metal-dependent phosphotriesterase family hydrolase
MAYVMTVAGPVPAADLGITLAHEHLYCDLSGFSGKPDNRLTDVQAVTEELHAFRAAGGRSIMEMTTPGIGRSPVHLRAISAGSGVQVVSGIALYDPKTYPEPLRAAGEDELADYFIREIEEGTAGSRAGFIGELYTHNASVPDPSAYTLLPGEERVFRAAATAQARTGVAISTHACLGRPGLAQLRTLERAGADLTKVAIGHCDAQYLPDLARDLEYYVSILERGAFCGFDMIGWTELLPDARRAERIAALVQLGYAARILLSTDTCRLSQLRRNGGRGYDYVFRSFLPLLTAHGVTAAQIHAMLVEAPRALLARTEG